MPTAQNVDVFLARLIRAGLLAFDPLVDDIRHGDRPRGMSERTAQIRFRRAVGISHRKLTSIDQAQHAARLLTAGRPIADVVTAAGYYDQPQLARAMRWAIAAAGVIPAWVGSTWLESPSVRLQKCREADRFAWASDDACR